MNIDKPTPASLGEQISFLDGTKYMRMPNGELRRMSPRAYQIRKENKKKVK
jgi:hypothetical protein